MDVQLNPVKGEKIDTHKGDISIYNHQKTPQYRTAARKNLFEKHVSFEPSHVILSNTVRHSPNGIRNLNQQFSSCHFTDDNISDGKGIVDNYLTIDDACNTSTSFDFIPRFVTHRKQCDRT